MNDLEIIYNRVRTANRDSMIAVEAVKFGNVLEFRSYFAGCVPAPRSVTAKSHQAERIRSETNRVMLMPCRRPQDQLGTFYGEEGARDLETIIREMKKSEYRD